MAKEGPANTAQKHISTVAPLKKRRNTCKDGGGGGQQSTAIVVKVKSSLWSVSRLSPALVAATVAAFLAFSTLYVSIGLQLSSSNSLEQANSILDRTSAEFLAWFQANGGLVSDKISIATFDSMGRGISSRMAIAEDDELLFVPLDIIICRETIMKHASKALLPKYEKLSEHPAELLTAFLLLEQFKDSSSFWYSYLRILPAYPSHFQSVSSPLFFDSLDHLKELQDERMIQASTQEREQAKVGFRRFRRLFKSVLPADSKVSPLLEKRYNWARYLINSRAFSIRGDRFLTPFGDMFNGKPQPERQVARDGNGNHFLLYHRLQEGLGMDILADRPISSANQQVFEDYGDNDNYVYFLYHGFIMEDNPYDCASVELPTTLIEPSKRRLAVEYYHQHGRSGQLCVTKQGRLRSRFEEEIVQFYASVMALDDVYAETLCSKRETHNLCVNVATQIQQDRLLAKAIRHQLAKYPTTEENDQDLLESANLSISLRHAVWFRLTRKRILKSALFQLEKLQLESDMPFSPPFLPQERFKSISAETKVDHFSTWIAKLGFPVNHVELKYVSSSMGYGTFATKTINNGEAYLSVPVDIVMDTHSALRSSFIRKLIVDRRHPSARWTDSLLLLLHLLHEKFAPFHTSKWQPYLEILPDQDRLGSPLFYMNDGPELQLLRDAVALDLWRLVHDYRERVEREYASLSIELLQVSNWITWERFRWATAILDSRSIWWSGSRHLVPLLDMVNCMEISRHHAPHATRLNEENNAAVTRASSDFKKGDQIVENYAQPNYIYLLYHGFVLHDNSYDCAHFHFELEKARLLPPHDMNRKLVIAQMESMQLNSWSQDVCIGGQKGDTIEKLLRLALIAKSPERAADVERASRGQLARDHFDVAKKLTTQRMRQLSAAMEKYANFKDSGYRFNMVLTFIRQQHILMARVLQDIKNIRANH